MLVTDEMVATALGILFPLNAAFNEGAHERLKAKIRSALEAALSHAARQEAPINLGGIDRKLVGGEAVAVVANRFGDPEAFAERELRVLIDIQKLPIGTNFYLTPAQPPASAGVGRKLIDDLNRIAYGYLPDGDGVDTSVALWAEQTLSRMAASSGRKGDEMP